MFRRKKWKYLILDEAHMIKNWKSQRWQVSGVTSDRNTDLLRMLTHHQFSSDGLGRNEEGAFCMRLAEEP